MSNLIGETIIELTDAAGNVETFHDKNIVTDGIKKWFALQQEFAAQLSRFSGNLGENSIYYNTSRFAGIPGVFGGMVAYEDPITEEPGNFIPPRPSENTLVACANQFTNTSPFKKRGSPNLTETLAIENGYKFVWDFSNTQGNGLISSICLCFPSFGFNGFDMGPYCGPGVTYFSGELTSPSTTIAPIVPSFATSFSISDVYARLGGSAVMPSLNLSDLAGIKLSDKGNPVIVFASIAAESSRAVLYVFEMVINFDQADSLSASYYRGGYSCTNFHRVDLGTTYSVLGTSISSNTNVGALVQLLEDGTLFTAYRYSNSDASSSSTGSSAWAMCHIDLASESPVITSKKKSFYVNMPYCMGYDPARDTVFFQKATYNARISSNVYTLYTVRFSNTTEVFETPIYLGLADTTTPILCTSPASTGPFIKVSENEYMFPLNPYYYTSYSENYNNISWLNPAFGITSKAVCPGGWKVIMKPSSVEPKIAVASISPSNSYYTSYSSVYSRWVAEKVCGDGTIWNVTTTYSYVYLYRYIPGPLLTINNLATPVTKTADKTMKITYIVRKSE